MTPQWIGLDQWIWIHPVGENRKKKQQLDASLCVEPGPWEIAWVCDAPTL